MIKDRYLVLLVDDSVDDRLFMRKALERSTQLLVAGEACDGQEAIDYLKGEGPFENREAYPWPDVLLLDLKMPRKNGFDVLKWIKSKPLKPLAVVVVSGAFLEEDVAKSLALGADGYFKKTSVKHEQKEMVHRVEQLLMERL